MHVPMMDLRLQYASLKQEIDRAVAGVLETQRFRGGPVVEGFERAIADYVGAPHALGVATGTDAILLMIRALDLKPGDEVITTPFTFFATGGAIVNAGGVPVFVDIDPATFNIDPAKIEAAITPRTRAIVAVHIFGQCADMDPILEIGKKHGLVVFEDAAQALGAKYKGRKACAMAAGAGISYYPSKNLGAAGEGGMVVANEDWLYDKVRLLRAHGAEKTYIHQLVGTNSHLPAIQAAVLHAKLARLDAWNARRRELAAAYHTAFADLPGVTLPATLPGNEHVWHQYVLRVPRRDDALARLRAREIECGVFYPLPLHRQECFAPYGCAQAHCPEADRASAEVLALPIFPEMTEAQQAHVIAALREHAAG